LNGPIDILVGTPLKVLDCVKKGLVDLSQVRMFILDEADRLLETGNLQTVMDLYNACPSGGSGGNRLQVGLADICL
jgi:ATP-dependent RNA helicase DDX1